MATSRSTMWSGGGHYPFHHPHLETDLLVSEYSNAHKHEIASPYIYHSTLYHRHGLETVLHIL